MKRILLIVLAIFIIGAFCSCNNGNINDKTQVGNTLQTDTSILSSSQIDDIEVDEVNRTIIATALNIEPNNRNVQFVLSVLDTINAGTIQKAELSESNNEQILNIISEDGTPFSIYLTKNGSVEAVKNNRTDEWIIQSAR